MRLKMGFGKGKIIAAFLCVLEPSDKTADTEFRRRY